MWSPKCEQIAMARMAIGDGEEPAMPVDEVTAHLEGCADCRRELEQLDGLAKLLNGQERREVSPDLWPAVSERLAATSPVASASAHKWPAFVVLGLLLVIFKLVEMIPERDLGFLFKLAPLLVVAILFACVKENPFKINLELTLEGDRQK